MTKKNKQTKLKKNNSGLANAKIVQLQKELSKIKLSRAKKTPFADVGAHLGSMVGFNRIGKEVGGFVGRILGSGDYKTNFASVSQNQLTSSVPAFSSSDAIVTHREYIQEVVSSSVAGNFSITSGALNPGVNTLFPWLSTIAQNYEEYEILGMIFEFKTTSGDAVSSTNTALGSVIMATVYDPTKPAFTNKQQMENYNFAQSCKPSESAMHAVECKKELTPVKSLYIRNNSQLSGTDLRWSDFGTFSIATVGQQGTSVNLGELWVSYKIALRKPRLTTTLFGSIAFAKVSRTSATAAIPFGSFPNTSYGTLSFTWLTNTTMSFVAEPFTSYYLVMFWRGSGTGLCATPAITFTNATNVVKSYWNAGSATALPGGESGSANSMMAYLTILSSTVTTGPSVITITGGTSGVMPASIVQFDLHITQVDDAMNVA